MQSWQLVEHMAIVGKARRPRGVGGGDRKEICYSTISLCKKRDATIAMVHSQDPSDWMQSDWMSSQLVWVGWFNRVGCEKFCSVTSITCSTLHTHDDFFITGSVMWIIFDTHGHTVSYLCSTSGYNNVLILLMFTDIYMILFLYHGMVLNFGHFIRNVWITEFMTFAGLT